MRVRSVGFDEIIEISHECTADIIAIWSAKPIIGQDGIGSMQGSVANNHRTAFRYD